jgi:hypothetical protein
MKETILLEVIGYIVSSYGVTTVTDYELRHHKFSQNDDPHGLNQNHKH